MFHPHFLNFFFGNSHCMTDAMALVAAFKVEQDLQEKWREERERECRSEVERTTEGVHSLPVNRERFSSEAHYPK